MSEEGSVVEMGIAGRTEDKYIWGLDAENDLSTRKTEVRSWNWENVQQLQELWWHPLMNKMSTLGGKVIDLETFVSFYSESSLQNLCERISYVKSRELHVERVVTSTLLLQQFLATTLL